MASPTRHVPSKLDLTPQVREPSPTPTVVLSPEGLRQFCKKGSRAEILYVLNNWLPTFGALDNSPEAYRPAQCEAARAGRISVLRDFLAHGCPLFGSDFGETVPEAATKGAVIRGDTMILDFLIKQGGWDVRGSTSAMMYGLQSETVVKWFLAQGCDPNAPTRKALGLTMTTSAVSTAPISVIKFLISEGGAVCGTDAVAQAVKAHVSSVPGRLEIVECLLDNGASIDAYAFQDATDSSMVAINGRETGLILATRGNKIDMVELLLKRGADRSLSTGISRLTKEETALEIAEKMRHENVARLLRCEYLE